MLKRQNDITSYLLNLYPCWFLFQNCRQTSGRHANRSCWHPPTSLALGNVVFVLHQVAMGATHPSPIIMTGRPPIDACLYMWIYLFVCLFICLFVFAKDQVAGEELTDESSIIKQPYCHFAVHCTYLCNSTFNSNFLGGIIRGFFTLSCLLLKFILRNSLQSSPIVCT